MTVNIQFKRGQKVNLPSSANSGTPLWCEDTKELYIGTGDSIQKVGGSENDEIQATYATIEQLNQGLSNKSDSSHNHDSSYSTKNHTHSDYASSSHIHSDYATNSALTNGLNGKSNTSHNHDTNYAAKTHTHTEYASSSHTHTEYASTSHSHSDYATTTALTEGLNGKSSTSHNHNSAYAPINTAIKTLAASGTIALSDNSINKINATGNVTFTLPTVSNNNIFHQILVQLYMSAAKTINLGTTYYFNKTAPDLSKAGYYNLIYEYDANLAKWVVGSIVKGAA